MKIISGELGGRLLKTCAGKGVRPAMARTREAIFSMLESRGLIWEGKAVLDLFAGCGSLAFECLSRGASQAMLVDKSPDAVACLKRNVTDLGLESKCRVIQTDVQRFLRQGATPFDLVFIDPPYRLNLAAPALELIAKGNWLNSGAFVLAEVEKEVSPRAPADLAEYDARLFGQTCIHIWTKP